jgi:TPR repeat protein
MPPHVEWSKRYKLARQYLYGSDDTAQDFEEAYRLFLEEAQNGNALAMHDLGRMFADGLGRMWIRTKRGNGMRRLSPLFSPRKKKSLVGISSTASAKCTRPVLARNRIMRKRPDGLKNPQNKITDTRNTPRQPVLSGKRRGTGLWRSVRPVLKIGNTGIPIRLL